MWTRASGLWQPSAVIPPTKERELVFSGYIRESRSVLDQLDRLLLLLVQYDQSQDHDAESVTAQLEEITSTIHLYEHN